MSLNASMTLDSLSYQWQKLTGHENVASYLTAFGIVLLTYAIYHVRPPASGSLSSNRHLHILGNVRDGYSTH